MGRVPVLLLSFITFFFEKFNILGFALSSTLIKPWRFHLGVSTMQGS
jgi:hypothetical protein